MRAVVVSTCAIFGFACGRDVALIVGFDPAEPYAAVRIQLARQLKPSAETRAVVSEISVSSNVDSIKVVVAIV